MYTLRRLVMMALALLVAILQCLPCDASPVMLDKLFGFAAYQPTYSGGGYGSNQYGYYGGGSGSSGGGYGGHQQAPTTAHKRQAKGRNYKDICRVVNPAPYALPGRAPYPAAPFCPY